MPKNKMLPMCVRNNYGNYCGCCGNEIPYGEWCMRCSQHIKKGYGIPPWERTYFAQYGKDCPFQEEAKETEEYDA